MSLNQMIIKIAMDKANNFMRDTTLLDAIVEMDNRSVYYLLNEKYYNDAARLGYQKNRVSPDRINVSMLMEMLESCLNSKRINVLM